VAKSIERLSTFTFYLFPLILLILDAAFIDVSEAFLAVITSIHIETAIPKNHGMICALAWTFTSLPCANINPLKLLEIVEEQVLIEVSALLLVTTEEVEFVVIAHSFSARPWKRHLPFAWQ